MSSDVEQIVLKKLDTLERKIDLIAREGCSKADSHASLHNGQREIFTRLNAVEQAQAEGRGKLAVAMIFAGAVISLFLQWLGKHLN